MEHMISDKRKDYLRTTTVKSWLILLAVLIMLLVFILWAFVGNMLELQHVKVISTGDGVYGYVDLAYGEPASLGKGMEIVLGDGTKGTIHKIDHYVYTLEELLEKFDTSLVSQLDPGNFSILFEIETSDTVGADTVQDGWVVMGEIRPITLWFAGVED